MKNILLVTSNNPRYRDALVQRGFMVSEYSLPASPDLIKEIEKAPECLASITEVIDAENVTGKELYRVLREKGRVVCFAGAISADEKSFLLDCGITDVLLSYNESHLVPYLKIINEEPEEDAGFFVVLDDIGTDRVVMRNLICRYGLGVVFVNTVDELFERAGRPGTRFILVNLGAKGLDLNGLVRKFYLDKAARSIPVLAYKDMREGLFVHELVGGLNRLTRYILSREELLSLLADLLFRKEVIPLVGSLKKLSDFDANTCYDTESLGQAFFQCEKNIFNQKNLHDSDTLSSMMKAVQGLNRAVLKAEGLKWLRMNIDRKDISTAGREG
jgi:hypothetical protein